MQHGIILVNMDPPIPFHSSHLNILEKLSCFSFGNTVVGECASSDDGWVASTPRNSSPTCFRLEICPIVSISRDGNFPRERQKLHLKRTRVLKLCKEVQFVGGLGGIASNILAVDCRRRRPNEVNVKYSTKKPNRCLPKHKITAAAAKPRRNCHHSSSSWDPFIATKCFSIVSAMEIQRFSNSADLKPIVRCVMAESLVVETPILLEKSLLLLLLQVECLSEVTNAFQNSVITDQRFPMSELNKVKEPDAENNDAGEAGEAGDEDDDSEDSEDDSGEDEDDGSESEEESDDDEEDSDDEVEANGDEGSDDDDEDEESDEDEDDDDEDDDDDDDDEDNKLPWTRKK